MEEKLSLIRFDIRKWICCYCSIYVNKNTEKWECDKMIKELMAKAENGQKFKLDVHESQESFKILYKKWVKLRYKLSL
jgi:hypothetical protein